MHLLRSPSHLTAPVISPQYWLLGLIVFQLLVWTCVPLISGYPPGLDVVEMHAWSLAPQWGYYKHPPLPAWIFAGSEWLLGKTQLALVLPSAASIALTYWAIARLGKKILAPKLLIIALLLSATSLFYQLWAVNFNHNVAQIPAWAWSLTLFYEAITYQRIRDWFALGAMFGLALLAKYTAILIIPCAILFILSTQSCRARLQLRPIWFGVLAGILVFGPHLIWLARHHFGPLHYVSERLGQEASKSSWAIHFASFIGMVLLAHIVTITCAAWAARRGLSQKLGEHTPAPRTHDHCASAHSGKLTNNVQHADAHTYHSRFLFIMGLGPLCLALLIGLTGETLEPMWSSAMLPLLAPLLVYQLASRANVFFHRRWLYAWVFFQLLVAAAFLIKGSAIYYTISHKSARAIYPAQALATQVVQGWQAHVPHQALRIVAGPIWEAGVISFYAPSTPHVLTEGDFATAPWITPAQVTACGMVLLQPTPEILARFPGAQQQSKLVLPAIAPGLPGAEVTWALLPPNGNCDIPPSI
ncbi:MAG: glycosyltransferase family 39 protein [Ottowia sp.]|nr:glycosyltransferase family 39 protein [Ottowia sp.]